MYKCTNKLMNTLTDMHICNVVISIQLEASQKCLYRDLDNVRTRNAKMRE